MVGLAAAFLTRLLTRDVIADPIRKWFGDHLKGRWEYLVACPWCSGVHATALVFAFVWHWHSIPLPPLAFLVAVQVNRMAFWVCEMLAKISED